MTTFGVTPSGFVRKTVDDIVSECETDQRATMADDLDVSAESVVGQQNGIFGHQLGEAWEALDGCYHGFDPDASEDFLLDMVCRLTGTSRSGATASRVNLSCTLLTGTTLTTNEQYAAIRDRPDIRFTPETPFTAPSDGVFSIVFVCERKGPIAATAGHISVIATPLVGWNGVVNPLDAELGDYVELDAPLRLRRLREISAVGSANTRAIAAALSRTFGQKLETITVYENESDVVDANGLPPHSIEALIYDGDVPALANDDVAKVIWTAKTGGIPAVGNTSGNVSVLFNGVTTIRSVGFSRAERLSTYLTFVLTKGPDYVGDDVVRAFVAAQAEQRYKPGDDVIALVLKALPLTLAGVIDVTSLKLGFAPSPTNEANLIVGNRQVARFDSSRITVTSV